MFKKQDHSKVCCCRNYNCIDRNTGCSFKNSICSICINVSSMTHSLFCSLQSYNRIAERWNRRSFEYYKYYILQPVTTSCMYPGNV